MLEALLPQAPATAGSARMNETRLRPIDQAGVAAVRAVERKVIRRMRKLVEQGALDASLINDNGLDDQGSEVILNERRKRVALDMRKSKRHAPVYIDFMKARVESTERADALRDGPRLSLNVGVVVEVRPAQYPVKMIDHKGEE